MNPIFRNTFFFGAICWLFATQPATQAATQKSSKSASTKPSAQTGHNGIISRSPYLGAIAVDAATGKVLFEDQADAKGSPASTLKLMDLLIILEKIEHGQLSLQDQVP